MMRSETRTTSSISAEMNSTAVPPRASCEDLVHEFLLGRDVDAARGLVEDQHARLRGEPARDDGLLLVAAGELADRRFDAGRLDAERRHQLLRELRAARPASGICARPMRACSASTMFSRTDSSATMPLCLALLGAEAQAECAARPPGCRARPAAPSMLISPAVARDRARTAAARARCGPSLTTRRGPALRRARSSMSTGLSWPRRDEVAAPRAPAARRSRPAACARPRLSRRGHLAAHHGGDQRRAVELRARVLTDELAVAQHGDAVADLVHLVEEMRDEQDRHALVAQPADEREQRLRLRRRRGSRWARRGSARAHRWRRRAPRSPAAAARPGRPPRAACTSSSMPRPASNSRGAPLGLAPVDAAAARPGPARITSGADVLRHRQVRAADSLSWYTALMPSCCACIGECGAIGSPSELDAAGIGRIHAGQHLDQRRLAGAVLAHERVHFAGAQRELDAGQRLHAGKGAGDAARLEARSRASSRHALSTCASGCAASPFPSVNIGSSTTMRFGIGRPATTSATDVMSCGPNKRIALDGGVELAGDHRLERALHGVDGDDEDVLAGLEARFLDGLDGADGHVVVVRVQHVDLARSALRKASMTSLPLARVKSPVCERMILKRGLAAMISSKPFLRSLAGAEPTVPCSSTMFTSLGRVLELSRRTQRPALRPSSTKSEPMKADVQRGIARVDRAIGEDHRECSRPWLRCSTVSQPVSTTGENAMTSTFWAMKRAQRLDLVFLLLLRVGEAQVDVHGRPRPT